MAELPDDLMPDLPPEAEAQLAALGASGWDALEARYRRPDAGEALRTAASEHLSGDRLDAFCAIAKVSNYVDKTGEVDQDKLSADLRILFDLPPAPAGPRWQNFGQHQPPPPMPGPGDAGRWEARKRFGGNGAAPVAGRGSAGAAEAQKRFGKGGA